MGKKNPLRVKNPCGMHVLRHRNKWESHFIQESHSLHLLFFINSAYTTPKLFHGLSLILKHWVNKEHRFPKVFEVIVKNKVSAPIKNQKVI